MAYAKNWDKFITEWTELDFDISDMLEAAYWLCQYDGVSAFTNRVNEALEKMDMDIMNGVEGDGTIKG